MPKKDPRIDAYIEKATPFARPILRHLRKVVHAGCPNVEETIKWGMPHFTYYGMFCGMAAFKQHCAFGFWKNELLVKKYKELGKRTEDAMGQLGRITSLADLPPEKTLLGYVKDAATLREKSAKLSAKPRVKKRKPAPKIPKDFLMRLRKNEKAHATFAAFSPSHQREYVEWITEAKREETRARRVATALEWLAAGKSRNWKYERN
jgi:uncharacterized protein YdeI (YjbR/CyaY-like superfamily)